MAPQPESLAPYVQYLREFNRQQLEHHRRLMREKEEEQRGKLAIVREKAKIKQKRARQHEDRKREEDEEQSIGERDRQRQNINQPLGRAPVQEVRQQVENQRAVGGEDCQRGCTAPPQPNQRDVGNAKIADATPDGAGVSDPAVQGPKMDPNVGSHASDLTLRAENENRGTKLQEPAVEQIEESANVAYQSETQVRPPTPMPPLFFPEVLERHKTLGRAESKAETGKKMNKREEEKEKEEKHEDDWDVVTKADANPLQIDVQEEWAIIDHDEDEFVEIEAPQQQQQQRKQREQRSLMTPVRDHQEITGAAQICAGQHRPLVRPVPAKEVGRWEAVVVNGTNHSKAARATRKASNEKKGRKENGEKQSTGKEDGNVCVMPGGWS